MDIKCIVIKLIVIIILLIAFYILWKKSQSSSSNTIEQFENNSNNQIDYLKLNETYIDSPDGNKSLEMLYVNYSGMEVGKDIWENKTLDQCMDTCNELENCVGFSRELVNDDSPAKCFPKTNISNCYSNRKGDMNQMQNAIKYNSYIKNTTPDIINKCIGDEKLTLNRSCFIKSYMFPNKYIGSNGDGSVVLIEDNDPDFTKKCNFRIEIGKDGIGTISLLHIDSNKYIYRNTKNGNNIIMLKDLSAGKTDDKQRCSFNILDSMKNLIKFKCLLLDGETIEHYISINPDNQKYIISTPTQIINNNTNDKKLITFKIVSNIISSKIITNNLPNTTLRNTIEPNTTSPNTTSPNTIEPNTTSHNTMASNTMASNSTLMREVFEDVKLDKSKDIPLYKNLFNTPDYINVGDFVNDKYSNKYSVDSNEFMSISKKLSDEVIDNQLKGSIQRNQDEYEILTKLNQEIEREVSLLNMDVNGKNDKLIRNLDKMRISDMAGDYFALKSIYPYPVK